MSSWTAPLPDIALHTIEPTQPPGWHFRQGKVTISQSEALITNFWPIRSGCDIVPTIQGWGRVSGEDPQLRGYHQGQVMRPTMVTMSQYSRLKSIFIKRKSHKRVILNVGGIRHEVMWKMLEQVHTLCILSNLSIHGVKVSQKICLPFCICCSVPGKVRGSLYCP